MLHNYKGRNTLQIGEDKYGRHKEHGFKTTWRCNKRKKVGCKAYCITVGKALIKHQNIHNHN